MSNDTPSQHKREIKSFVVRSSRMTTGQQQGWDMYWEKYGLDLADDVLDFKTLFGNDNPVVFEIGFGMGGSLHEMAKAAPNTNFIGVEVHRPGVGALLAMIGGDNLSNVRVMCCDAIEVINKMLPENSIARLQLYFPDPWHKKRHHKRRIVQPEFLNRIRPKLIEDGVLHFATDWEPYAEQMIEVLDTHEGFDNMAADTTYAERPEYRPATKFERRGLKLGHGVWDILYQKN